MSKPVDFAARLRKFLATSENWQTSGLELQQQALEMKRFLEGREKPAPPAKAPPARPRRQKPGKGRRRSARAMA